MEKHVHLQFCSLFNLQFRRLHPPITPHQFLGAKVKRARILTHEHCVGQCLHYLLHSEGGRLLAGWFPVTFSCIYSIYRRVSLERFSLISVSDIQPLPMFPSQKLVTETDTCRLINIIHETNSRIASSCISPIYIHEYKGFQSFLCIPRKCQRKCKATSHNQPTDNKLVNRFSKGNDVTQVQKPCKGFHYSQKSTNRVFQEPSVYDFPFLM